MSVIGSNIIAGASGTVDTSYQISRSLRFNSADSAYLSRTPASAGNRQIFTYSGWLKPSSLSGFLTLFSAGTGVGTDPYVDFRLGYTSGDMTINCDFGPDASRSQNYTTAVHRDPAAHYHIVIGVDTTQATAANRIKIYVNNSQLSYTSTATLTQNRSTAVNNTNAHNIGRRVTGSDSFLNGLLSDVRLIDGQQLDPTSFGEFDAATGVWVPKAYTGTYGTNGFWLKFDDNSGVTATTLGKDSSGNGNNWTPNNFSVTAGVGNDSLVDSPTNYGTDTGAGGEVRGNYATLNPLKLGGTLANGNLDYTSTAAGQGGTCGTIGVSSGKWYWEATVTTALGSCIGIANDSYSSLNVDPGTLSSVWMYYSSGTKYNNGSGSAYAGAMTNGDVIGIALDADAGSLTFYKNGVSQGVAFSSLPANTYYPFIGDGNASAGINVSANFGQRPFAYTAPSGFKALCTQNLPTPTIGTSSTNLADDYFNVVTYTGTGSSLSVTGVGFQPDLVWIKGRSGATDHALYDAVRGVQKQLESNTTTDETTETTGLTAFGTDGFTVGALAQLNTSTATYVGWNWKESTTSGFDIVTYTGNGANRTISHGLGVAPKMVIVKARTTAGTDTGWPVWHTGIANTNYIDLNGSAASTSGTTYWNSTSPTSSVFSVGTAAAVNTNNDTYVAYLFAEIAGFSKFGSYTGNGSTDGPFVYCGFRPRWVMIKRTDAAQDWVLLDTSRDTYNQAINTLYPNLSNAENTTGPIIDILSNGFKLRIATGVNVSTAPYIFAAFAEAPFNYSRAR